MSTKETSTYTRALLKEALTPWIDELRAANRTLRAASGSAVMSESALVQELPTTVRPTLRRLLQLMARERDLDLVADVISELEGLITEGGEVNVARVASAVALEDEDRTKLEARLRQRFGQDLLFEYEVDPNLLGGVRVRVGDQVIDGTLANRLNAMRERILG